ncbi:hipl1 protein [Dionaea muscipula]
MMSRFGFGFAAILSLLTHLLLFSQPSSSLPLCTDFRAPTISNTQLAFCPYNGSVCCDSAKDLQLQNHFQAMKIPDSTCASLLKSILCASCDPFSAELFRMDLGQRPVPVLCNTTNSSKPVKSSFCSTVWDTCKDVTIINSPFAPSLQGKAGSPITSNSSTLTQLWQSEGDFCDAFGGTSTSDDDSLCFDGQPVSLNTTETVLVPLKGLCLEKIGDGSYINMVSHPDGSNRAFFSNLPGKIWLATIPEQDSGEALKLDESNPFVDLTDQVLFDTTFGMLGMAFHPNFVQNGRFFASYNCDKLKSPVCDGRCACNSDVNCDPSKLNANATSPAQPCQYQSVIAEFSANGTSSNISRAMNANPAEVRRIFTLGLPFTNDHGGQILFGPADGYLYFMTGDGGGRGDPYNFAQNKKSVLGKILRLDVDDLPSEQEINRLGLWGNYTVPRDNPYSEDKELEPEIWAMGFRNPWRCSFDAERPHYFACGDVGLDHYEEVDLVTKGGNYGWRIYEGPVLSSPQQQSLSSTGKLASSSNLILPISSYSHADVNKNLGSAAISGGFFYRSQTDPCMYGSYLYGDLYAYDIWAAAETPKNSGNFTTTKIPFSCAGDSPLQCSSVPNSTLPALGYIFSFGEDNRKDVFVLARNGVYRVVRPSRCNYTCSKESVVSSGKPSPSSPSNGGQLARSQMQWLHFLLLLLVLACLY